MQKKKRKHTAPIHAFTIGWVIYTLLSPAYSLKSLVGAAVVGLIFSFITRTVCRIKDRMSGDTQQEQEPEPAKQPEPEVSYGPEVDAVIAEGKLANSELGRLYSSIRDDQIREKIRTLMQLLDKIVDDARHDPTDVPQIKRFFNYYPPTTIKLLNAYDRMSDQGIEGENITGTMTRIEEMLDTTVDVYKKQLDSLFANQALDIETDIAVMNAMLAREGLGGKDFK